MGPMLRPSLPLVLLAGCGAAPAVAVAPLPAPDPGRCELVGEAPEVELRVTGLSDVIETRWPAAFSFGVGPDADVELDAPLAFSARATVGELPLHVPRRIAAYGIVVEPGVRAVEPESVERGVEVTLEADARVRIRMPIGCNALALGPATAAGYAVPDGTPSHRLIGDAPLPIAASPSDAPFATVLAPDGLQFRIVARSAGRARIVRTLDLGVIDGWVDASRLRPEPPGTGWEIVASSCCCGGVAGYGIGRMPGVLYEGPAILRRGGVLRGADGFPWARASADAAIEVIVFDDPSRPFVVDGVDGLTSHGRTWLGNEITASRDDVVLPPAAVTAIGGGP